MPTFEPSPDTRILTDALLRMAAGETLSYKSMTEIVSRTIDGTSAVLQSARRRAERDDGFVFGTIRNIGVQRLKDSEIVDLGETGAKALRRAARRTARRIANVAHFDDLVPGDQLKHNGALALMGAVMAATKASTLRRLEAASDSPGQLSLGRTFELFKGD